MLSELRQKIDDCTAQLAVVGLGYVGLPAACMFADAGFRVIGLDLKEERVARIQRGESPIEGDEPGLDEMLEAVVRSGRLRATTDVQEIATADVVLIVVETPVDAQTHIPEYRALRDASRSVGAVLKRGALVVVESTVAPGTSILVVQPTLEEASGYRLNEGFYLGACPERVMPGRLLSNMRNVSRVCGGSSPETSAVMKALYKKVVIAEVDEADVVTAELVKTVENSYRDVQIAFANEVALICEKLGANVWQVRDLVNKSPQRNLHLPGAGVGGHCIPKDPWLLVSSVRDSVPLSVIPSARAVNDSMPHHMAQLIQESLHRLGVREDEALVAVLGYSYLENSDDTRLSPSEALCEVLVNAGIHTVVHDPWVAQFKGPLVERVSGCDLIALMVRHREYESLDLPALAAAMRHQVIVDGRNGVDPEVAEAAGFTYVGIGRGDV